MGSRARGGGDGFEFFEARSSSEADAGVVERKDPDASKLASSKDGGERCCSSSLPFSSNLSPSSPNASPTAPNTSPVVNAQGISIVYCPRPTDELYIP